MHRQHYPRSPSKLTHGGHTLPTAFYHHPPHQDPRRVDKHYRPSSTTTPPHQNPRRVDRHYWPSHVPCLSLNPSTTTTTSHHNPRRVHTDTADRPRRMRGINEKSSHVPYISLSRLVPPLTSARTYRRRTLIVLDTCGNKSSHVSPNCLLPPPCPPHPPP